MDTTSKTLVHQFGGFRSGNLLDNGDMEKYYTSGVLLPPYGWSATVVKVTGPVFDGYWTCSTFDKHSGLTSCWFNYRSAGAGDYALLTQDVPLHAGAQAQQLGLLHHLGFWYKFADSPAGVMSPGQVQVTVSVVLVKVVAGAEVEVSGNLTWNVSDSAGWLGWTEFAREFRPAEYFAESDVRTARSLRLKVKTTILLAPPGTVTISCIFDDLWLDVEGELSRPITFGDQLRRSSETQFVRAGDGNRTMRWRSTADGRSKLNGVMPLMFCPQEQRDMLLGLWCYSRRAYLLWWPNLVHYPDSLNIVLTGEFNLEPANPNLTTAGYKGSLTWEEL